MSKIYHQLINQATAEQISRTYVGNYSHSTKVKEDVVILRTYDEETLENTCQEAFSKSDYDKFIRLIDQTDTELVSVREWFNVDKPELEQFFVKEKPIVHDDSPPEIDET
tara:strand:+ start:245 stop:574 length:330 start_codon:yes stop_codon:yes gene_type:complete